MEAAAATAVNDPANVLTQSMGPFGAAVANGKFVTVAVPRQVTANSPWAHVLVLGLGPTVRLERDRRIELPDGTLGAVAVLSADATRIAWVFYRRRPDRFAEIVRRFWKDYHVAVRETSELWVSDSTGEGLREVAFVPASNREPVLRHVRWLPGNRTVGLSCHGKLYAVPAN
jgi:hypothetical protein